MGLTVKLTPAIIALRGTDYAGKVLDKMLPLNELQKLLRQKLRSIYVFILLSLDDQFLYTIFT